MLSGSAPLGGEEFAALMHSLGPFESAPRIAVAVSGGADSLALCLLAADWAAARGGSAVGLTVDHGLRAEAAAEACQVAAWLAARGIAHEILPWEGAKPASGIQAAARQARYDLLGRWCRARGILHLLLAHHRDDQAETLLLRLGRGSGVDGLAAMAPMAFTDDLRLLRPLLGISHGRLVATLKALGQPWIEDPSNRSEAFRRARLRRLLPSLAAEGLEAGRLAATAARMGRARMALEAATADLLVRAAVLHPAGYAVLDPAALGSAPEEISLRALAGLCRTVGGRIYPHRLERLERLHGEIRRGLAGRRTFSGCVVAPMGGGVLVSREPAAIAEDCEASAGQTAYWDDRFTLRLGEAGRLSAAGSCMRISALGEAGWRAIREDVKATILPRAVLVTLPAIIDHHGISAVPHLGYVRRIPEGPVAEDVAFTPRCPLVGSGHRLV